MKILRLESDSDFVGLLEDATPGEKILLEVLPPHVQLGESVAKVLQSAPQAVRKHLTVSILLVHPSASVEERRAIAQRIAQRA